MKNLLACLMLILCANMTWAELSAAEKWQLSVPQILSAIEPENYYLGSDVKEVLAGILDVSFIAITQAAEEGSVAGAAEVYRILLPEREGWKYRAVMAEKMIRKRRWVTVAIAAGALIVGGATGYFIAK